VAPFGVFVKNEGDIDGLVHISEVSRKKVENISELYKVGDEVNVIVLGVDVERRRLSLSIKAFENMQEKEEKEKIVADQPQSSRTASIGAMLKLRLGDQD
jgi:small subunit ribosomal protein S1